MADAKRTIDLVFNGVDKTGAATQAALNNLGKFSGNISTATQPIADFTASALKLEAALLTAGLAVTGFAIKTAGDFDAAFREISTLLNQPVEDLGEFRQAILDYAATSTAPLEEITSSIYNAISAGVEYGDAVAAVAQAEKLSIAGKADLNDSLLVLVSTLNAYGLGMEEAGRFSDLLFQAVRSGQTTLPELASSLASVSGLAATAGVDFDQLLAAIATLTATGTPTAQAITQVQGAISAILKPTGEARDLAESLGIEFNLARLKAVGFDGILQDVKEATGGNAEQMAVLFGRVEALNGVLTLTGLGADKFAETLEEMANSAGATDAAVAKMAEDIGKSTQKIKNGFDLLLVALGTPLLDEFGGVAEGIAAIFRALGLNIASGEGLGSVAAFVETMLADLEKTVAEVARNLPAALEGADYSGFINGLQSVSGAVSSLFEDIDLTSPEGLTRVIEGLGKAFEGLSGFSAGVISSFKPLFDQLIKIAGEVGKLDAEIFDSLGNFAGFATQANVAAKALTAMLPSIEAVIGIIGLNQAAGLVGSVGRAAAAIGTAGGGGLVGALLGLNTVFIGLAVGGVIGTVANELTELATGTSLSTRLVDLASDLGLFDDEARKIANTLNDETSPAIDGAGTASRKAADEVLKLSGTLEEIVPNTGTIEDLSGILADAANEAGNLDDKARPLGGTFSVISSGSDSAADSLKRLGEAAEQLRLEEKLALIEAQTRITTAQIEANAQQTVAAFESIASTIDSTGESVTSLFGLLGDDNISKFDKLSISDQIEVENERRQEALDLQQRLTQAQIAALNAQTARLRSDTPLITVNGDGLAPHLEAMMFEVLEAIQVRVNTDGYAMLLGI